jgi:hypothetical protein
MIGNRLSSLITSSMESDLWGWCRGHPIGILVLVTVTVSVITEDSRDDDVDIDLNEKMVAVIGGGVVVMIVGQTVIEMVLLMQVLQGGQLTSEQGIVKGSTRITVDPTVLMEVIGTVTCLHPKIQDLKAFKDEGIVTISGGP